MADGHRGITAACCRCHAQVLRLFIAAQALEAGLAQQPFLAPAAESHFSHHHRFHPAHACRAEGNMRRQLQHRFLHRQRCQRAAQRLQRRIVEAGADPTDIAQAAGIGRGQQQRTEADPAALGRGVADDDEFVGVLVLHLHPAARAGIHVGRIDLLADDAFKAGLTAGGEHRRAMVEHVFAVGQRARFRSDQVLE